jgi:hypothetical protein
VEITAQGSEEVSFETSAGLMRLYKIATLRYGSSLIVPSYPTAGCQKKESKKSKTRDKKIFSDRC